MLNEKNITLVILIFISNISSFIQSYQMYKKQTSFNMSITTWFISVIANILWILYCIRHNESKIIIVSSTISLIGNLLVIYMILSFTNQEQTTLK